MDIREIVAALREERERIEEAILPLERLAAGQGKRRGRPPAWMAQARKMTETKRRGRPTGRKTDPAKLAAAKERKAAKREEEKTLSPSPEEKGE